MKLWEFRYASRNVCFADEIVSQPMNSPGGSSTSSRDASPSREISPLARSLKPPIVIKKGARGFGFTLRAIRVYMGDSDIYTLQHVVVVRCQGLLTHFVQINVKMLRQGNLMNWLET